MVTSSSGLEAVEKNHLQVVLPFSSYANEGLYLVSGSAPKSRKGAATGHDLDRERNKHRSCKLYPVSTETCGLDIGQGVSSNLRTHLMTEPPVSALRRNNVHVVRNWWRNIPWVIAINSELPDASISISARFRPSESSSCTIDRHVRLLRCAFGQIQ